MDDALRAIAVATVVAALGITAALMWVFFGWWGVVLAAPTGGIGVAGLYAALSGHRRNRVFFTVMIAVSGLVVVTGASILS